MAAKVGASYVLSIDISPHAVLATRCTLNINGIESYDVIRCDQLSCVRDGAAFDILIFNPPYLPVKGEECEEWIALSWCGGADGIEVITRALNTLKSLAPPRTVIIVLSTLSDYDKVIKALRDYNYDLRLEDSVRFFFEELKLIIGERDG